ncbi:MAG: hypothetical protein OXO50_25200 [Caldilineaceae bacterium]|nr:hypothetical protein [Caldilineaceae bacterium]
MVAGGDVAAQEGRASQLVLLLPAEDAARGALSPEAMTEEVRPLSWLVVVVPLGALATGRECGEGGFNC